MDLIEKTITITTEDLRNAFTCMARDKCSDRTHVFGRHADACTLQKAFDRAELTSIFQALGPTESLQLIAIMYKGSKICVMHDKVFEISRGVKQGDVFSTLICSAVFEIVARRWKTPLKEDGLKL